MRFKSLFLVLIFFNFFLVFGQKYVIDLIPDSLKIDAEAVIRKYSVYTKVSKVDKMETHIEKVITVFSPQGQGLTDFVEFYDPYSKIKEIHIKIYNPQGKLIKEVKKNEIGDYSADGFSLYTDDRVKHYRYKPNDFPYTVSLTYDIISSNTAFIRPFYPLGFGIGLEKASYKLFIPSSFKLFKSEKNLDKFNITNIGNDRLIYYEATNIKPIKKEILSPPENLVFPNVDFSISPFSLAGEIVRVASWSDFGKWYENHLLKGRDVVSEKTKNEILSLVRNAKSYKEKAKLIYEYMQKNTRYVSVQMGIGGWRPISAMEVDNKKYGDCKALVNYTKSLLQVAGIKSYETIINAGDTDNINKDLIGIQGNHMILTLPLSKDTIWLECTNTKIPFGYLGSFTQNRNAIMINGSQTKIIHTKKYTPKESLLKAEIHIGDQSLVLANISMISKGLAYDDRFELAYQDKEDQVKIYKHFFDKLVDLKILKIEFENDKDVPSFTEKLVLSVPDFLKKLNQDEFYFMPASFRSIDYLIRKKNDRQLPIYINKGELIKDSITFHISDNYNFQYIPDNLKIEEKFGSVEYLYKKISNQEFSFIRIFKLKQGLYKKEEYKNLYAFYKKIHRQEKKKIIINIK